MSGVLQNPLPDLIQRTNEYLLNWRTCQMDYENTHMILLWHYYQMKLIMAHLYYLPKAHLNLVLIFEMLLPVLECYQLLKSQSI